MKCQSQVSLSGGKRRIPRYLCTMIRYPENRGSFTMMVDHVCHENLTLDKTDWSFDALD